MSKNRTNSKAYKMLFFSLFIFFIYSQVVIAGDIPPASVCGNGVCESGESCSNCPQDCPQVCGDGACNCGENCMTCPNDCPTTMNIWIRDPTGNPEYCAASTSKDVCNAKTGCIWEYRGCSNAVVDWGWGPFALPCSSCYGDKTCCDNCGCGTNCNDYSVVPACSSFSETSCKACSLCSANIGCYNTSAGIIDPTSKMVVNGECMIDCSKSSNTETCYKYYYTCDVVGYYQGQVLHISTGTYSPWKNLWYCTCNRQNPTVVLSPSSQSGYVTQAKYYTVTVNNNDNLACGSSTFILTPTCPSGWECSLDANSLSISPGSSANTKLTVTPIAAAKGDYSVSVTATFTT